ncbi:MAG: alpha/beta hydrolase [Alphaproteobacteria bacterium]|nr:alpha/beta hydrolase [Alphaproteobacteria bacterium]
MFDAGDGAPVLFLHGCDGFDPGHRYVARLCEKARLLAPSHPGFGRSTLPDWITEVDDIAYIYLALLDHLQLDVVDMVACSFGGWIAAEMATKAPRRFRKIVLSAPVGVKTGPTDHLDIPDIFAMPEEQLAALMFHDPAKGRLDVAALSDEQLAIRLRNRESLALLTWEPYMHNPKLRHRLHRVDCPVLFLRGASDGLVSDDYLRRYAALLPDARCDSIPAAGHASEIEQPDAFVARIAAFLAASTGA